MTIKIKNMGDNIPNQAHPGEWIDLYVKEGKNLKAGEFALLNLGVCVKVPEGYEAILVPRSSTFKNYGLIQTNGIGIIDETYCGNEDIWRMPVYATKDIIIPDGAKIAQFRIQPNQGEVNIEFVHEMEDMNRGGFGSTGK